MFLAVLKDAKELELATYVAYFKGKSDPEKMVYWFFEQMRKMFQENESLKFWLRMEFFPPTHLYGSASRKIIRNMDIGRDDWFEECTNPNLVLHGCGCSNHG